MKTRIFTLFFSLIAMSVQVANAGVEINTTNFPDENFWKWVFSIADINKDFYLSDSEIANWKEIDVKKWNIASLKGIEYFTALQKLNCENNQLTSLDLSKNTALNTLYCYSNQLTSLNVTKNTKLTVLDCNYNQLTSLNVTKNTQLSWLGCMGNQLSKLDVSMNTKLEHLDIAGNKIKGTAMDELIAGLPTREEGILYAIALNISTEQNVMTVIQVNEAKKKGWIPYYTTNKDWTFTIWSEYAGSIPEGIAIDETNFPDEKFRQYVKSNFDKDESGYLSDSEIAAVKNMGCVESNISNLKGIEHFTALETLQCWGNKLTSLDVSKNTALKNLNCRNNKLTSLNVTKNTKLISLECYNNQLTSLDVTKNTALTQLECDNNKLASLDVTKNTALKILICKDNQLTSLDVTKNTALTELQCENNQLSSLDVTKNTVLEWLYCDGNKLTSLNVTKNTALIRLFCSDNQLTKLDVTKNTKLEKLYCYLNKIKGSNMDALIAGLPTKGGVFRAIAPNISGEQNVLTTTQVAEAKKRNWTPKYWTGNTMSSGSWANYAGTTVGIAAIEYTPETDNRYYTLDGKPIIGAPTQKGIYIHNGKKEVVR